MNEEDFTPQTQGPDVVFTDRDVSRTRLQPVYNRKSIYIGIWAKNYSLNHVWKASCDAAVDHQHGWRDGVYPSTAFGCSKNTRGKEF